MKDETYRVAERYGLEVTLVANSWMRIPDKPWLVFEQVGNGFDEADDWIVEHAVADDIVIADDIPLAARCLEKGARVLSSRGRVFTEESIGGALANREFLSQLRENGLVTGGPAPFEGRNRSDFLQRLDALAREVARKGS